jgi:hypothetical protein
MQKEKKNSVDRHLVLDFGFTSDESEEGDSSTTELSEECTQQFLF